MGVLHQLLDILRHLDVWLPRWGEALGPGLYVVLFLIVFCETGLVVTPFLPGDSLLFAVGALITGAKLPLNLYATMGLLIVASVVGDAVNYSIGRFVGPAVFTRESSRLLNKKHLLRAQEFYERYGGKAIVFARFVPIVRTFAPFVAGIGKMQYRRFAFFNVTGAVAWITLMTLAGVFFGDIPFVKKHFELVVVAIVVLSIVPAVVEFVRERKRAAATG